MKVNPVPASAREQKSAEDRVDRAIHLLRNEPHACALAKRNRDRLIRFAITTPTATADKIATGVRISSMGL